MPAHPNFFLREMNKLSEEQGFRFSSDPKDFNALNEWDRAICEIKDGNKGGVFQVQQMPGCCAVLTVFYVYPRPMVQEQFIATLDKIELAAKKAGFGSLLMAQTGKFEDWNWLDGWEISESFINAKSGNGVMYLTKDLEQPGKVKGLEF